MIPFVRDMDFAYGRADRVSPRIRRVVANNPGPFTYLGTGTYLIDDGQGGPAAVIDPGPDDPRHLTALLNALDGQTVSHILVTHTHRDHSPLSHPLAERVGAPILAAEPPRISGPAAEEGYDDAFTPDRIVGDGEIIQADGWTIEVLATPGHASNHLAFVLAEENALFSGDHVMGWSTTVVIPPDGDMTAYLDSLDRVIDRDFSILWPTHGPPVAEPRAFLAAYREHRLERERQVLDRLRAGDRLVEDMVPVLYANVDQRLWPAASLSVLAHLIRLAGQGIVTVEGPPTLKSVFRIG